MIFASRVLPLVLICLLAASVPSRGDDRAPDAGSSQGNALRTELKKVPSVLNIPVEMSTDDLAKLINQATRKELYKGSTKTKGLSTDIVRNGPIAISAAGNFIYVTLPVAMSLSYGMFETLPIPLKLKFRAAATVTPDWRITADVFYLGLSDPLAEEISLGPLKFKPRSTVDGITQPLQKMLSELVTRKLNELLPLKTQVAKVWTTAQSPVLLDKKYRTWLKLTPIDVMLSPLYAHDNRVRLSTGINTFAEVVVGPEPAALTPRPLPNLRTVNGFDKSFRISLNTDVFYKDLHAVAAPLLLGRQFSSGGDSITIKGFDLSASGEKIIVTLETQGSLDGTVILNAKPSFNPQTSQFSLDDVDFDMQTRNLLLATADWFLHGSIRSIIQEKLNLNLSKQLEQSRQLAAKALARLKLAEHVFLKCDIRELKFRDAIVLPDRIAIQVYTEGESAVLFE